MQVIVNFDNSALTIAAVHLVPSWLDRLLLVRERDDVAIAVPDIAGGRRWHWDSTGRRITSRRVVDALEDERAELELARMMIERAARQGGGQ